RIAKGEIPSGGGGGGGKQLSVERQAEIATLEILFGSLGQSPSMASASARKKGAWRNYAFMRLSDERNSTDVPGGDIDVFLAKNAQVFADMRTEQEAEIRAQ